MPSDVVAYQVLLAVADELDEERRAFAEVIRRYNEAEAIPRGVLFVPVGWATEYGPPAAVSTEDFDVVDYFVLVLRDHWPPGAEAEFALAELCLRDEGAPLAAIVPFFKAVPERQLHDPGDELRKILQFREGLEDRRLRGEAFDSLEAFETRLRWHLSRWLIAHERRSVPGPRTRPALVPVPDEDASEKRWQPPPLDETSVGFNKYGLFLQREGMSDDAETIHQAALQQAEKDGSDVDKIVAYGNLGEIYSRRQKFSGAEHMFRKALELSERHGNQQGTAASLNGLGVVLRSKGDLEQAEAMFRRALKVEEELDRPDGMAMAYANLEVVLRRRGLTDDAEKMRRLAQELTEEPEYPRGNLFPSRL